MPTATVDDILTCLRQFDGRTADYVLWLGAGASVSSGIPSADDIVTDLLRESHAERTKLLAGTRNPVSRQDVRRWAQDNLPWFAARDSKSEYALALENVLKPRGMRNQRLRRLMRHAKPSKGYSLLGLLLKKGLFDTVVSTNFDDLVRVSCAQVLGPPITTVNTSDQFRQLGPHSEEVRLLRLHGDFDHGDLLNTERELEATPEERFAAVRRLFAFYGLIVIGYGGWDVNLMRRVFAPLWTERDNNVLLKGVYWCHLRGSVLSHHVQALLEQAPAGRAFSVEITGFDELISQLAAHFGVRLPYELEFAEGLRVASEAHAFIKDLLDKILFPASPADLLKTQQEVLNRMASGLDLRQAALVHRAPESGSFQTVARFNAPAAASEVRLDSGLLARVTGPEVDTLSFEPSQVAHDPSYEAFWESRYIQSFFVWRSGQLAGFVTFGSDQPLADNSGFVKNVVRILVCAPEFAAQVPAAGSARAGAAG